MSRILNQYQQALDDAEQCIRLNPTWAKGYGRKGLALLNLERLEEAKEVYEAGLKLAPTGSALQNLQEGLKSTEEAMRQASNPMGKMFGPSMWGTLAQDPVTAGYLNDPQFVQKMKLLQQNPNMLTSFAQSDPQVGAALGVLLGIGA